MSVAEGKAFSAALFIYRSLVDPGTDADEKAIFHYQVHFHDVAEWVKSMLTDSSYNTLLCRKSKFVFIDKNSGQESYGGPIMLYIILGEIGSSVFIGAKVICNELKNLRMHDIRNDVDFIADRIEQLNDNLICLGSSCDSIFRYIITALMLGPNDKFNNFLDQSNDGVESGRSPHKNKSWQDILTMARIEYTNMVATGDWPCGSKLIALVTKLHELESKGPQIGGLLHVQLQGWETNT